jgi:lipopolysaccharide transport system ATP-binding protein
VSGRSGAQARLPARVSAQGVGVEFLFDRQRRLVSPTLARLHARRAGSRSWGLREIDLEIGPGEAVALVGRSGGGKTTLLRTIAGVFTPDAGTIHVEGRIGSLLSVGAGVMSGLTGRENAELLGVLAGLSLRESRQAAPSVQAASGLGALFDRPVSSYSQGMRARLGFASADEADPAILLLDEVHEALDHEYRALVQERAREILAAGGIVVAAGHDHPLLEELSSRALWLDEGRIRADGPFAAVRDAYLSSGPEPDDGR